MTIRQAGRKQSESPIFLKHSTGETEQAITLRKIGLYTNFKSLSSVSGRDASADVSWCASKWIPEFSAFLFGTQT